MRCKFCDFKYKTNRIEDGYTEIIDHIRLYHNEKFRHICIRLENYANETS